MAIDPLSLIPLFVVITSNIDSKQTLKLSLMVFLISSSVLTFFLLFGNVFLAFMGISINSFQIVGGIFLLFISYEMVFEKRMKRKKNLSDEILDDKNLNNIAVFPISKPKYILLVLLDEPKPSKDYVYHYKDGSGWKYKGTPYNTAGWTSVEIAGKIIEKIGPILAINKIDFYDNHVVKKSN